MYFFYATVMAPFLVMGLALCCGDILRSVNRAPIRPERRALAILVVAIYVGAVVTNFVWLWPILTGSPISPTQWDQQIWLPSWG